MENGKRGQCYIAGGQNMSYFDFFTKVAEIAGGLPAPRFVLPGPLVMAGGAAGSVFSKLTGNPAAVNLTIARLSLYGTYYSSDKAIKELGMAQTRIETGIEQSIRSLREYGHIE